VEPLISDMNEVVLIGEYDELIVLHVRTPLIDGHQYCMVLFVVSGRSMGLRP
jgi:hypothetical protein